MNKVYANAAEALDGIARDGLTILAGGFGLCGIPENLLAELRRLNIRNLTVVSNNAGVDDFGLGVLMQHGQIKKMISSYVGENALFERSYLDGSLEVEFTPQGTLAERVRAAGAGIPAFFTKTGYGTLVAEGKEVREFDGEHYIMERALHGDLAIVKAYQGDTHGNLVFRRTAQNLNREMAAAGKITIAEVEHLVPAGSIDPNRVHVPGVYVQRIFQGTHYEKRIERLTTRPKPYG